MTSYDPKRSKRDLNTLREQYVENSVGDAISNNNRYNIEGGPKN